MVVGASGAQQPKRLRCCLIAPRLLPCAMCPPHFLGVYYFMLQPLYQGSWFWRTDTCPGVLHMKPREVVVCGVPGSRARDAF